MLQRRRDTDLLEEPLCSDSRCELVAQHLDRDPAVVPQVASNVHRGHPAAGELELDLVAVRQDIHESRVEQLRRRASLPDLGGRPLDAELNRETFVKLGVEYLEAAARADESGGSAA